MTSRRTVLGYAAGVTTGVLTGQLPATNALAKAKFRDYPFSLGVASGDPAADGAVLWTRLAPKPLEDNGGMPGHSVEVDWEVSSNESMTQVVRSGTAVAAPELAHSVHVTLSGLDPDREYFYRFRAGGELSPVGRTRTVPAGDTDRLRFAFASCQNFTAGYYAAYRHMAAQDLDLVVHLGDYIYEGSEQGVLGRGHQPEEEVFSLDAYRIRYGQYKSDPDLQAAHAACPWIVTMDDHEVDNNWAGTDSDPDSDPDDFLARRAAAFQALYEHQPLRATSMPQGSAIDIYRRVSFGNLVRFNVLDTRQYRSDQPCGGGIGKRCDEAFDADRTMLGTEQEQWLFDGLTDPAARWNVIAQQVLMAELDLEVGGGEQFNLDNWAGYPLSRDAILKHLLDKKPSNPVVLTGDIHATFVNDLKTDFNDPSSPTVGTEFAGTSISSHKPDAANDRIENNLGENPHVKYYQGRRRGYVQCDVSTTEWRSNLYFVDDVTDPGSAVTLDASFVVKDGVPGAQRV